ncbi:hypothetical Protein YC6258_05586 [Gynuella sunshinyii YC6258]|uniref:Uncharacterized protein n=2 Tax=Gynuella sunshinyii TaxID=1445505 RepID=A0A0C5W4S6_9GAMM|nr:hypothetical Protein YC6258_05586 [Gynuella sunshinyii YC6258]
MKGSKQKRLVVGYYHPWWKFFKAVLMLILLSSAVLGGYWYGHDRKLSFVNDNHKDEQIVNLQSQVKDLTRQLESAVFRAATAEKGAEVDRVASQKNQQTIKVLKDQVASLQEEVTLYKGIMAPANNSSGLRIQEMSITSTTDLSRFRYKLMLTQVGDNSRYIQGFVEVSILGQSNGEKQTIPLKDISEEVDKTDIKFRYRYFQEIRGELNLPEGFTPEQIQVVAQATGNKTARVEKLYDWKALETGSSVGQ